MDERLGMTSGRRDPQLDAILGDLRAADHQQWSAFLADEVQRELSGFPFGSRPRSKAGTLRRYYQYPDARRPR